MIPAAAITSLLAAILAEEPTALGTVSEQEAKAFSFLAEELQAWMRVKDPNRYGIDEDVIIEFLKRATRLTVLGVGSTRAVLDAGGGRALKLQMGKGHQNRAEALAWISSPPEIQAHLMPVIAVATDGSWLLMEKAPMRSRHRIGAPATGMPREVYEKLVGYGFEDVSDDNTSADGRLIDYAWFRSPSKLASRMGL